MVIGRIERLWTDTQAPGGLQFRVAGTDGTLTAFRFFARLVPWQAVDKKSELITCRYISIGPIRLVN